MFDKILIANRGEIAVRIIRACREMGIKTVAVFYEPDREALHTQLADDSVCIGSAKVSDSYLNVTNIISAAVEKKVQAIHPGFGFLSENSTFAAMCEECNIKFIGPSAKVIDALGNKSNARDMMIKAGIAKSKGEGRRLIQQGGVSVNDEKITDVNAAVAAAAFESDVILRKGKKVFHKFTK